MAIRKKKMFITPSDDIAGVRLTNEDYLNTIGSFFDPMIRAAQIDIENERGILLPYEDMITVVSLINSGFHPLAAIAFAYEDIAISREIFDDVFPLPDHIPLFDVVRTPDNRLFAIFLGALKSIDISGIFCWAVINGKTVPVEELKSRCELLKFHRERDQSLRELGASHPFCVGPSATSTH